MEVALCFLGFLATLTAYRLGLAFHKSGKVRLSAGNVGV